MTKTPLTDARPEFARLFQYLRDYPALIEDLCKLRDFARDLERKLAEAENALCLVLRFNEVRALLERRCPAADLEIIRNATNASALKPAALATTKGEG